MRLIQGILFFVFSCIPGCGQMHQGHMKRGISQTILFCAMLTLAVFLEMGALAILLVPLWLYSFFDSYNLRRQRMEGTEDEDAYLFGMSDLDARRMTALLSKRHSIIGWALVFIGLYMLYNTVTRRLLGWLRDWFSWADWLYGLLVWDAPRIVVTLLIIALGMWFIRGPKKRTPEDIPAFTPPLGTENPPYRPEFFQEAPHAPDMSSQEMPEDPAPKAAPSGETAERPEEAPEVTKAEKEASHGDN